MKKVTSRLMREAHKLTKEIVKKFPGTNYKVQLGLCISYLLEEGVKEMKELKGTEKQVKWANDIRENLIISCNSAIEELEDNSWNKYYGMLDLALINKLENAESFIEGRGRGGFEAAYPSQEEKALTIYKQYAYRVLNNNVIHNALKNEKEVKIVKAIMELLIESINNEDETIFEGAIQENEFNSNLFLYNFYVAHPELH